MAIVAAASVRISPDLSKFRKELSAELRSIKAELQVNVTASFDKAKAQIDAFVANESRKDITKNVNIDRNSLKDASDAIAGISKSAQKVAISTVAFTAITAAAQAIGPLLAQAAASALLIPGALAASGVALIGFKASLEAIKPQLKQLKTQFDTVFKPTLIPAVNNLKNLIVTLTPGLKSVSAALGSVAFGFTKWLSSASGTGQLNTLFQNTAVFIRNIGAALAPLTSAFLGVSNAALPIINQLTTGFAGAAQRFADFVNSTAGIAKIQSLIKGSFSAFHQLGQILQQVGGIITNVFSGLSLGAGNLAGTVLPVLTKMNAALGSVQGQQALASLGAAMSALGSAIASTIGPLIQKALPALTTFFNFVATHAGTFGPIIAAFAIFGPIVAKLVPVITTLFDVLGPLFTLIRANPILLLVGAFAAALASSGQLTPVLKTISDLFQQLASAILPPLNAVFQALVQALTPIINAIMPVLVQLFQALTPILSQVASVIGGALVTVIQALAPPLLQIVQALLPPLLQIITALLPVLTLMADLFAIQVKVLGPVIGFLAQLVAGFIAFQVKGISVVLGPLAKLIGLLAGGLSGALKTVTGFFSNIGSTAGSAGSAIGGFFSQIGSFFSGIGSKIATAFTAVVNFFTGLPAKIGSFLASLPSVLLNAFLNAFKSAATAVEQGTEWVLAEIIALPFQILAALSSLGQGLINLAVSAFNGFVNSAKTIGAELIAWVISLPSQIVNGLSSLITGLATFATNAWNGFLNSAKTVGAQIIAFALGLPGRIISSLVSLGGQLVNLAVSAWNGFINSARTKGAELIAFVASLPSRAVSALGNLGSLLIHSGEALLNGFIQGIKNVAGKVADAVQGVLQKARSLLPFSPAKEGPFSGKGWTLYSGMSLMQGLADGINKKSDAPVMAVSSVLSDLQNQMSMGATGGLNAQIAGAVNTSVAAAADFNATPVNITIHGDEQGLRQFIAVEVEENGTQTTRRVKAGMG